jgi:hypothetical protein
MDLCSPYDAHFDDRAPSDADAGVGAPDSNDDMDLDDREPTSPLTPMCTDAAEDGAGCDAAAPSLPLPCDVGDEEALLRLSGRLIDYRHGLMDVALASYNQLVRPPVSVSPPPPP